MIVVTGGAGFIGSNLVHALNQRGISDVLVVDDLSDGRKFRNLVDCNLRDYRDKEDFLNDRPVRRLDDWRVLPPYRGGVEFFRSVPWPFPCLSCPTWFANHGRLQR